MSAEESTSLILTASQELQLREELGSFMHLFNDSEPPVDQYFNYSEYENNLIPEAEDTKVFVDQYNAVIPIETPIAVPEMAVVQNLEAPVAPSLISNDDYSGPYNFEVLIKSPSKNSNWVYSEVLNKIYTMASHSIPIDFKWTPSEHMYVRATPLYTSSQYAQELVKRCIPHRSAMDPSNLHVHSDIYDHVLRCQNPSAYYCGSVESNVHLNVIVSLGLPQVGTDTVRVMYSFVCNNSCASGMNRKALEVVFTLEDEGGKVYGRKKVFVRVCSCPKRDKDKDEKESGRVTISRGKKLNRSEKRPYSRSNTSSDTQEKEKDENVCVMVHGKENGLRVAELAYAIITSKLVQQGSQNPLLKRNQEFLRDLIRSLE